ncbi:MAG: class I SAM-dependent methyltransferase [Acidimicrobiia bacterium]
MSASQPDSTDSSFGGSIPDIYDRYLVPLIFEHYAEDLSARMARLKPNRTLEVAAGSGVVTRAAATVLGEQAEYVATDLNRPMLDRAAASQPDADGIVWREADAMELPFDDSSFDLVLCQFGAMFFPDRVRAYSEARRVLRPGGAFIFNMWDRIETNEFADEVTNALAGMFPDDPPIFLARTPHGHHDPAVYRAELSRAGFAHVDVEAIETISVAADPADPAIAYCQGTPLRDEIERRSPGSLDEATSCATSAISKRFGDGRVEGLIRGYVITAI